MTKRRKLLQTTGVVSIAGLSGCIVIPSSDDDSESSDENEGSTADENEEELVQEFSFEGENTFRVTPAVSGGTIFAPNTDRNLYAVNVENGEFLWSHEFNEEMTATPAVGDGNIYTNKEFDNGMYSFDADSGDINWSIEPENGLYPSSPAYNDEYIFVTDNGVTAFNASSGEQEWNYRSEMGIFTTSTVALTGSNAVNVGEFGVFAVNQNDGSEQWTFEGPGEADPYSLATTSNRVIYHDNSSTIYIIDAQSGNEINQISTSEVEVGTIRVIDNTLYYNDDGLTAFDMDSMSESWSSNTSVTSPVKNTINGYLFALEFGLEEISGFDITSGEKVLSKSLSFGVPFDFNPIISGDLIIIANGSNSLFGYRVASS